MIFSQLSSRKRTLRKYSLFHKGITFHRLHLPDIKPEHWDRFYQFYLSIIEKWEVLIDGFFQLACRCQIRFYWS